MFRIRVCIYSLHHFQITFSVFSFISCRHIKYDPGYITFNFVAGFPGVFRVLATCCLRVLGSPPVIILVTFILVDRSIYRFQVMDISVHWHDIHKITMGLGPNVFPVDIIRIGSKIIVRLGPPSIHQDKVRWITGINIRNPECVF